LSTIESIRTQESPREILHADFKSLGGRLPISGGWGYTKEEACVINRNDAIVNQSLPFDGVGLEYLFVEKRIYEELIIFRPEGRRFSGIRWELVQQRLVPDGPSVFDHLVFNVYAFLDTDWNELKAEFEGPNGFGTAGFSAEDHARKRKEKQVCLRREFWFDITSFYFQASAHGNAT
jgi:hypothetical protein